jgi:hypothetical protein
MVIITHSVQWHYSLSRSCLCDTPQMFNIIVIIMLKIKQSFTCAGGDGEESK